MSAEEFISQLATFREDLRQVVERFATDPERAEIAFGRWEERFLKFLDDNTSSESSRFMKDTALGNYSISRGASAQEVFLKSRGRKVFGFIDDLVEEAKNSRIIFRSNGNSHFQSDRSSLDRLGAATNLEAEELVKGVKVDPAKVFVVHGRNLKIRSAMFAFLRSIGLQPIEWSEAVKLTGKATPYTLEVIQAGFSIAQAAVILFTPDDEARLLEEFYNAHEPAYEKEFTPQARPNVIFEAGMAMSLFSDRTLVIEFGHLRPMSDVVGLNTVRMNNSASSRQDVVDRLVTAGCPASIDGKRDWQTEGDFETSLTFQTNTTKSGEKSESSLTLPDDCFKILDILVKVPEEADGLTCSDLANSLQVDPSRIQYYLDTLERHDLIGTLDFVDRESEYYITTKGRQFVFER
jgi:predicted nucleotide-binding protein